MEGKGRQTGMEEEGKKGERVREWEECPNSPSSWGLWIR